MSTPASSNEPSATETASPRWKAPLQTMGELWQRHVASRFPTDTPEEAMAPDSIEIPVENLGKGLLNAVKTGLRPVTALGSYSVMGVQYAAKDSAGLVMKGVNKAKDLAASRKSMGCTGCEADCGEQNEADAAASSTEDQGAKH